MRSHRIDRQEQPLGDLGVRRPSGQQRHYLPLSFRQQAGCTVRRSLTGGGNGDGGRSPRIGPRCCGGQGDGVGLAERAAAGVGGLERGIAQRSAQTGMVAVTQPRFDGLENPPCLLVVRRRRRAR